MRTKFILSLVLVALAAIASVVIFVRLDSRQQIQTYLLRGGFEGLEETVSDLESYYAEHGSWQGAESLLSVGAGPAEGHGPGSNGGHGGGSQRLRLADSQGLVLIDASGQTEGSVLSSDDLAGGIVLTGPQGAAVGYLLPSTGSFYRQGDELPLIERLNDAALRAGLVGVGIALLMALALSAGLIRPIRQLTRAAHAMSAGDLSQRVAIRGRDELSDLGRTFNHMAASLQQSEERRRSMTADIAHELRTPLAVQRAQLEALLDGVNPMTPETLNAILAQTDLLTRLVGDLRTLALAEAGELPVERVPVDLVALTRRVVNRFDAPASARSVELTIEPSSPIQALGDPDRIEQILGNLLSNALRYTPDAGRITVALASTGLLTVHDSGPGIAPEALPHIFERFYRAERSRSRDEGGTGLGLAIARQLARAMGGDVTAANHPSGGAIFTVTLPLSTSRSSTAR